MVIQRVREAAEKAKVELSSSMQVLSVWIIVHGYCSLFISLNY